MDINGINNFVSNAVNQYVVRPTGLPGQTGIAGFVFDVLDEEMISVDSEITDHYVEDNYAIQDHISLKPVRLSVKGFVGELSNAPVGIQQQIMRISQQITTVAGYATQFTTQAKSVYDALTTKKLNVGNVINQSISAYNLFDQLSTTANKQQNAYNYFYTLWASRILCSVETPYKIFTNMAIESIRARQDGSTRFMSDFTITFKLIRSVSTRSIGSTPREFGLLDKSGDVSGMIADDLHGPQPTFAGRTANLSSVYHASSQVSGTTTPVSTLNKNFESYQAAVLP